MVKSYIYIIALSIFFFLLVPGAGAFHVRNQWRQFRKYLLDATFRPFVSYADVHGAEEGPIGEFRFIGALEALEEDTVWLQNSRVTLSAFMNKCQVYLLPSQETVESEGFFENNIDILPDESPQRISWRNIFSLPEGTTVFITGLLFREAGRSVFKATRENPLIMIIFDGSKETIIRRSIWGGRQKNEYWNQFTLPSLIVGFFSLLIYAYRLFQGGALMRLPTVIALTFGLLPIIALLPPGIFGLFIFRNYWRRARILRAERDLLFLPLRYFISDENGNTKVKDFEPARLPDGTLYSVKTVRTNIEMVSKICTSDLKVRVPSFASRPSRTEIEEYRLFGSPVPAGNEVFYLPAPDPMAEYLLIPGDPEGLSEQCNISARKFEYISVSSFALGIAANCILVFRILYAIIK